MLLISLRCVTKAIDGYSFDLLGVGNSGSRGCHDMHLHILTAQGNCQTQDERAGSVPFLSRERVREKQYVHVLSGCRCVAFPRKVLDARRQLAQLGALRSEE